MKNSSKLSDEEVFVIESLVDEIRLKYPNKTPYEVAALAAFMMVQGRMVDMTDEDLSLS